MAPSSGQPLNPGILIVSPTLHTQLYFDTLQSNQLQDSTLLNMSPRQVKHKSAMQGFVPRWDDQFRDSRSLRKNPLHLAYHNLNTPLQLKIDVKYWSSWAMFPDQGSVDPKGALEILQGVCCHF